MNLMASFWAWWIVAPRAVSLYIPGLQRLFLGANVIHREQGPVPLCPDLGVTGTWSPNLAHDGGILAAL